MALSAKKLVHTISISMYHFQVPTSLPLCLPTQNNRSNEKLHPSFNHFTIPHKPQPDPDCDIELHVPGNLVSGWVSAIFARRPLHQFLLSTSFSWYRSSRDCRCAWSHNALYFFRLAHILSQVSWLEESMKTRTPGFGTHFTYNLNHLVYFQSRYKSAHWNKDKGKVVAPHVFFDVNLDKLTHKRVKKCHFLLVLCTQHLR